jgi:hypothetical protein
MKLAEKNRILMRGSEKRSTLKISIPKPKGSVGQKGYRLIECMKLNSEDEEEKGLYNNILVSLLHG